MNGTLQNWLDAQIQALKDQHLYKPLVVMDTPSEARITVNGNPTEVPENLTISALLTHLGMGAQRVALERNLELVRRNEWDKVRVQEGDRYEIVQFVGGGS